MESKDFGIGDYIEFEWDSPSIEERGIIIDIDEDNLWIGRYTDEDSTSTSKMEEMVFGFKYKINFCPSSGDILLKHIKLRDLR